MHEQGPGDDIVTNWLDQPRRRGLATGHNDRELSAGLTTTEESLLISRKLEISLFGSAMSGGEEGFLTNVTLIWTILPFNNWLIQFENTASFRQSNIGVTDVLNHLMETCRVWHLVYMEKCCPTSQIVSWSSWRMAFAVQCSSKHCSTAIWSRLLLSVTNKCQRALHPARLMNFILTSGECMHFIKIVRNRTCFCIWFSIKVIISGCWEWKRTKLQWIRVRTVRDSSAFKQRITLCKKDKSAFNKNE